LLRRFAPRNDEKTPAITPKQKARPAKTGRAFFW
jgi:hypothetical protein